MRMPDVESPTNNSSLWYICVVWVMLGLKLMLLAASRLIGVCENVLTWLFRHVHDLGGGNGMKSNNDFQTRPLILVVNNSRGMRVKSLPSLLKGSLLVKLNACSVPEGTWNTADHYDLTEKDHEIITQQPISDIEDMYCKAEIVDNQSHTGYQRFPPCHTFIDTIRKNHMVHPGDACTLISDYQDEPTLPEKSVQWFLLKCIAIVAIHELLMINFRKIQDPENKDDACGSSCRNMVNTEMDFASKEVCVKLSNVAGSELKNQSSNLESRNLGEASLSEFDTNRIMDTKRSNAQRRPSNSDAYRLGGDRLCQSPTVTSGLGDVPWEVETNLAECKSETHEMSAEKHPTTWHMLHEDVEENNPEVSNSQAGGKPYYSDIKSDDRPEGLDTQVDGAREGSDMQTDGTVDGKREGSDMQVNDKPEDSDRQTESKQGGSDMQTDGKVDGTREGSDMQVNDKPEDSDRQNESMQEGSDMQANDEAEHSDMQTKSKPENSDKQADDKPEGSDIKTVDKPQGSGIQTDDKPQGSGIQTDDKPQGSGLQADDKPQGSGIQTDGKPQGSGLQADDKPQGSGIQTDDKPQGSGLQADDKPQGSGLQADDKPQGSGLQADDKPHGSYIQTDDKPQGSGIQTDDKPQGSGLQADDKPQGSGLQADDKPQGSGIQTDGKPQGSGLQADDKPQGSGIQTDGKPQGSGLQADDKPQGSGLQADDKPQGSGLQADDKPQGSGIQTDGKPQGSGLQADDKPQGSGIQTDGKPQGSGLQADDKPQGSGLQADDKPQGSDIQTDDKPQGSGIQTDGKPQGSGLQADDKPQGSDIQTDGKPQGSDIQTDEKPKCQKKSESGMNRGRYCARKLKGARKKTKSCVRCRILFGRPSRCGPYLFALMIRSHGDRRKCFCVYQRTVDRTEQNWWRGSKNTHHSTSEETGLQVCSGESAHTSHTSRKFETNRLTEEAIVRGQGHHPCASSINTPGLSCGSWSKGNNSSQGNPKACTSRIDELLYTGGDSMETIKLKEELVFSLRPDQPLSKRQTVEGLAKHCLPNKQRWEIDKLMQSQRAGQPREACVDHVLQELIAHGLKVGHVVQYFSQDDSRRDDVVRIIENIHQDCQFCTYLFNDDDY